MPDIMKNLEIDWCTGAEKTSKMFFKNPIFDKTLLFLDVFALTPPSKSINF